MGLLDFLFTSRPTKGPGDQSIPNVAKETGPSKAAGPAARADSTRDKESRGERPPAPRPESAATPHASVSKTSAPADVSKQHASSGGAAAPSTSTAPGQASSPKASSSASVSPAQDKSKSSGWQVSTPAPASKTSDKAQAGAASSRTPAAAVAAGSGGTASAAGRVSKNKSVPASNAPVSHVADGSRGTAPVADAGPSPAVKTTAHATSAAVATRDPEDTLATLTPDEDEGERAFNALFGEGASVNVTATSASAHDFDQAAVREIFSQIAANHARPIKNFISELHRGRAAKEWIDVVRPVLETIANGAESMGLTNAAKRMTDFGEALSLAMSGNTPFIEPDARELILTAYQEMAETLPEAFREGEGESRRETIIIHSLLKQIPGIGHVTFQRLYGAGLTTLEALFLATEEDLKATTGINADLCARIRERFQEYRRQTGHESAGGVGQSRLHHLVQSMKRSHEEFQEAFSREWMSPEYAAKKRESRQARERFALEIEVALADRGAFEMVEAVRKLSFEQRIEALELFLASVGVPASTV